MAYNVKRAFPTNGKSSFLFFFQRQQPLLFIKATTIASQPSMGSHYSVARDDNGQRIAMVGASHSPRSGRLSDHSRQFPIRTSFTIGNFLQSAPHFFLKWRTLRAQRQGKHL